MKEDLNLYHNEYNYIVVSWTIGYIIGQLVRLLILKKSHLGPNTFQSAIKLHIDSSSRPW